MLKGNYFRDKKSHNFRDKSMLLGSALNTACVSNPSEYDLKKDSPINKQ